MKRLLILLGLTFLSGCALIQTITNTVTTGNGNGITTPSVGQWVDYGGSEPSISGSSWAIPCCSGSVVAGYFYTKLATVPQAGQALILNFTVTGINPVWVQAPGSPTDTNPPTIHLFLWRAGDDLSCTSANAATNNGGYADYRLFGGRTPLVLGANQTISVPLASFTNCWGVAPANLQDELNNLLGVGVVFGGQSFAGHGIYLSSGSVTFTVNSLTVQ